MVALYDEYYPPLSRTDDAMACLMDRAQIAADEAHDAEYERRERIEGLVTFDELLEELTTLSIDAKTDFMECLACADKHDRHWIHCELEMAKARIVSRRMAETQVQLFSGE